LALDTAHRRILVTDDDPSVRALLAEVLADEGYQVSLSAAQDVAETARLDPNLILLDSWDATAGAPSDFLDRLQAEEATAAIPVIILTGARREADDRAAYFAARGMRVVLKPFALDDLLTAIGERLGAAAVNVAAPFTLAPVNVGTAAPNTTHQPTWTTT
jgi:DNA-binding response OmpR family regulator